MANCIFTTGSITHALKAKRILADYSIAAVSTKVSSSTHQKGCVYGIEFNSAYKNNVIRILTLSGIEFEEFTK